MGYQALLFCPEEKTARTVTQVLSELEFSVDSCNEPFAAVKKLMAQHFDAVVVDCDNEQNATLLFKSARNSRSNQTSLAVAVVEGQAGVAKAFRIGANLVLTKPINVEQAKGTLRVARGLLRKGDPAKPAAVAPTAPAAPTKATTVPASKPASVAAMTAIPHPVVPGSNMRPAAPPEKPVPAASPWVAAPASVAQSPDPNESDVLDIDAEADVAALPIPAATSSFKSPPQPFPSTSSPTAGVNPLLSAPTGGISSTAAGRGAASAPAPARVAPQQPPSPISEFSAVAKTPHTGHVVAEVSESPVPTFTFGGANAPEPPAGANKKAFIGIAAAVVVTMGLYFGWSQFHGKSTSPSSPVVQQPAPASNTASSSVQPSKPQPFSTTSRESAAAPVSSPGTHSATPSRPAAEKPETDFSTDDSEPAPTKSLTSAKNSSKSASTESSAPAKSAPESKPAPQPIMVKNGTTAAAHPKTAPAAEAPAPSALDIAPAVSGGGLPNLVTHQDGPKPVLQTLNISQGVSQGLLMKKVSPVYPPSALRMHVEGSVQLLATIGKSGSITSVKAVSGESVLSKAAIDAVKQWKYKPYYLNGDPVEIQTQITVNFKLPK